MSRSRKDAVGGHGLGHTTREYWSARPLSLRGGATPGRATKRICHRIERRQARVLVRLELDALDGMR